MCPCSGEYVWCLCGCATCKYVWVLDGGGGGECVDEYLRREL